MFNHSCNPNSTHYANFPIDYHKLFYTTKNIKKGEEIFINYGNANDLY